MLTLTCSSRASAPPPLAGETSCLLKGLRALNGAPGPAEGVLGPDMASGRGHKRGLYLPTGDVVFDAIRVLDAQVLDRKPVLEVADHPAGGLADGDLGANARPMVSGNCTTRLRNVYNTHGNIVAIGQREAASRVPGRNPAMAAVVDRAQELTVGQPGQLGSELVTLAGGRRNGHGEAIVEQSRDYALEPAHMVHIGDNPLIELADDRGHQRHAALGHVGDLTGILVPVGQHIAPEQIDPHARIAATLLAERQPS